MYCAREAGEGAGAVVGTAEQPHGEVGVAVRTVSAWTGHVHPSNQLARFRALGVEKTGLRWGVSRCGSCCLHAHAPGHLGHPEFWITELQNTHYAERLIVLEMEDHDLVT